MFLHDTPLFFFILLLSCFDYTLIYSYKILDNQIIKLTREKHKLIRKSILSTQPIDSFFYFSENQNVVYFNIIYVHVADSKPRGLACLQKLSVGSHRVQQNGLSWLDA